MKTFGLLSFFLVFRCISSEFTLTILHTNDVHSRVEEVDKYGKLCRLVDSQSGLCFGGTARIFTEVQRLRKVHSNVIVLDAGDQQTGTLWYKTYHGNMTARVLQKMKYDAVTLGNHDFDEGAEHALQYLKKLKLPVVMSNVNASAESDWIKPVAAFNHSLILNVNGKQIGVCGYIVRWVQGHAGIKNLKFYDEVESVRVCARKLKSQGIKMIIGLGHSGVIKDQEIAKNVQDVDVVVGGHSHTFLYTGTPPSNEKPYGPYPLVIRKPGTKDVAVVVQAYAFSKYLGFLKVTFDDDGKVLRWGGNPILLDNKVMQDEEMLKEIKAFKPAVDKLGQVPVGKANVLLDGRRSTCWHGECILGNVITDALIFHGSKKSVGRNRWSDVSIAVWQSSGIQASIPIGYQENVTFGDIYNLLSYENKIDTVSMHGSVLVEGLQYSVSKMTAENQYSSSTLLHVSGLRVSFKLNKRKEYIVDQVLALCTECRIPQYEPIQPRKIYKVMMSRYIAGGGLGFSMFKKKRTAIEHGTKTDVQIVIDYLKHHYPLIHRIEGRLLFNKTLSNATSGGLALVKSHYLLRYVAFALALYTLLITCQ